eukprot:TRINITY_DN12892_c0_g1_i3.p1 TRINITY_DN12892_c0_g1~~TRINITY_DN12892_c0_g1_i3.p1  ORF type:complete len:496 (-),score=78.13 TRINITY_DN12892_c0_g1_i3:759-2246(-)
MAPRNGDAELPCDDDLCSNEQQSEPPAQKEASNFIPAMGNFSIQYNFASASIAVQVLNNNKYLGHALEPTPDWAGSITLSIVFLGSMIGMAVMGRLGDVLGRLPAMNITLALTICGAVIPALAFGNNDSYYAVVCLGRLVLGMGVGGIYPLSAVASAESSRNAENRGKRVGKAFFWQQVGSALPYLVAVALVSVVNPSPAAEWAPQFQFRVLFAAGAIPAAIVLVASLRSTEPPRRPQRRLPVAAGRETGGGGGGVIADLRDAKPETRRTLIGTAGSWFIYDVAYYGTTVFTPSILQEICLTGTKVGSTCDESLLQNSMESFIVVCMGIPACLLSIWMIPKTGSRCQNISGFLVEAVLFAALAVVYTMDSTQTQLLFVIFCALTASLCYGPNVGTYVLPAICFPAEIRSTCHGLSATGGKLGAVFGAVLFPIVDKSSWGLPGVLWIQCCFCVLGAMVSFVFLKNDWEYLQPGGCHESSIMLSEAVPRPQTLGNVT